ncbi:MAG: PD-(D/E)XK nuclease family protein, partial [Spirochaetaceae bacterium]|nr:PD-(D/E)XK nuclease family protein [Spirochaetaceae bacterium]
MDFTELEKIFEDMKEINGLVKESKRRTPGIMNIAEIMRQHRQENEHSDIISFLLDPEEDHNHPEFGTCFLNLLTERGLKIRGKSIKKVTREAVTGAMRRMDIFIETDSEKIIVE